MEKKLDKSLLSAEASPMDSDLHIQTGDEVRAALAAGLALGRLDEAAGQSEPGNVAEALLRRREALLCSAADGHGADDLTLSRLLDDDASTYLERGFRAAKDIHAALSLAVASVPAEDEIPGFISQAFSVSEQSNARRNNPSFEWQIEEDAAWAADLISRLHVTPDPWTAAECVRAILTSGRFSGLSKRVALIISPWLIRTGFGLKSSWAGISRSAMYQPEELSLAAQDNSAWPPFFFSAVARSAAEMLALVKSTALLRSNLLSACPPERSSAKTGEGIDRFISRPVATARTFGADLGLTPRGAKSVLDRFLSAGIIEIEEDRKRNRIFICRKALWVAS